MSDTLPDTPDVNDGAAVGTGEMAIDTPDTASAGATVGRTLCAARLAANLSAADVAQALKFSQRQIELLEADNYAALPGNTIVRGFVRSYARFLKLDPESLLRMLDARSPPAPADVRPPENMGTASEAGGLRQYTPAVSVVIVTCLAAVLLGLWHFFGPAASRPTGVAVNSERQSASQEVVSAVPAPVAAANPQPNESAAPSPLANAPADNAGPVLLFVFDGRSWLEVTDAAGQKLHSGENPAGSRLSLNGQPPFEIVVGNAEKVKLTYGDRVINLAPHTRADVARLKLE